MRLQIITYLLFSSDPVKIIFFANCLLHADDIDFFFN